MKNIHINTTATFTAANGQTVHYEDIFTGIAANIEAYSPKDGWYLREEDKEDLAQDCFLRVVRSHGSYNPALSSPRTYGNRIAENCEKDTFVKAARRAITFVPFELKDEDGEEYVPTQFSACGEEFEADREAISHEALSYIKEKMASLSESYRQVLELHLKGLKPKKMAERLGCTPSAAATLLCRARKALAKALGRQFLSDYGLCA